MHLRIIKYLILPQLFYIVILICIMWTKCRQCVYFKLAWLYFLQPCVYSGVPNKTILNMVPSWFYSYKRDNSTKNTVFKNCAQWIPNHSETVWQILTRAQSARGEVRSAVITLSRMVIWILIQLIRYFKVYSTKTKHYLYLKIKSGYNSRWP